MTGYRRFVAYVYEYHKGRKGSNCGFIKVEVRETRCRMEVHLQCPGLTPQVQCKIYGFVRNAGLMDGILLGVCETGEGRTECMIETDAQNMADSGVALGKIGGIILKTENGAFFGTEWDDQMIRPDNFREIRPGEKKDKTEKGRIEIPEPKEISVEKPEPEATPVRETVPESEESPVEEEEPEKERASEATPVEERIPESEESLMEERTTEPQRTTEPEETSAEEIVPEKEGMPEPEKAPVEEVSEKGSAPEEVPEIEKTVDTQPGEEEKPETETVQEVQAWMEVESKLENEYEKENNEMWEAEKVSENSHWLSEPELETQSVNDREVQPGNNQEVQPANNRDAQPVNDRKIQPANDREMQMAPSDANPVRNSSASPRRVNSDRYTLQDRKVSYKRNASRPPASVTFTFGEPYSPFPDGEIINCRKIHPRDLAHFSRRDCSLRNNRFLMYGYYNFGHLLIGTTASGQCILGVPGGYDQQERFMANMFGFPYFKECRQIELPRGKGGYWYRSINAPNPH